MTGGWIHGPTIAKDGTLRFMSVSGVEKADKTKDGGCPRAWFYEKKLGRKEPSTQSQQRGTEGHSQIETRLGGEDIALRPDIVKGLPIIPDPGDDLLLEWDITRKPLDGGFWSEPHLKNASLIAAGVPFVGAIDLIHARGINKGGQDVEQIHDPEGTIEVLDWKFVKDLRYIKTPTQLAKTTQMVGYANWVFAVMPNTRLVRVSHGYFPLSGSPRKVTTLVTKDQMLEAWEHPTAIVRSLIDIAKAEKAEDVPANTKACRAYNRDCFHSKAAGGPCTATKAQGYFSSLGIHATTSLLKKRNEQMALIPSGNGGKSLLSKLKSGAAAKVDPAEVAKLAAEEAEAKRLARIPAGFEDFWNRVGKANRGTPKMSGVLRDAFSAMKGQEYGNKDSAIMGSGEIADVAISTMEELEQLVQELEESDEPATESQHQGAIDMGILPSDVPDSSPEKAGPAAEDTDLESTGEVETDPDLPTEAQPAEAVKPNPLASAAAASEGKKRGRPPGVKNKKADVPAPTVTNTIGQTSTSSGTTPTTTTTTSAVPVEVDIPRKWVAIDPVANWPVQVYVNCIPSVPFTRLDGIVDELHRELCQLEGVEDARLAGQDSRIGYGKWKAALEMFGREKLATEPLIGGHYVLDTRGSEIYEAVANALRQWCTTNGHTFVRGV